MGKGSFAASCFLLTLAGINQPLSHGTIHEMQINAGLQFILGNYQFNF